VERVTGSAHGDRRRGCRDRPGLAAVQTGDVRGEDKFVSFATDIAAADQAWR
jgi:hypothetical protein